MNNIIEVTALRKRYPSFALQDLSFALPAGYIMGFIGPNGAGKTTTIKAILGLLRPDGGSVSVFGTPFTAQTVSLREEIGIVMDVPVYVEQWTVGETAKTLGPFYQNWDKARFEALCHRFSLAPKQKLKDLSRGMKVKLQIAVALSHHAKLLIMDEPTSGLDPVARDELMEILLDFVADETHGVFFSTHITSDLEKVADYITYIKNGALVFSGEKDALLGRYVLIRGGREDLSDELRHVLIGLREHSVGFEGMLPTEQLGLLPPGAEESAISLDQIVVFMNKEGDVRV